MQTDVEGMTRIAQPLDEWCMFCTTKLATAKSADGVPACEGCAKEVLEALAKYGQDARDASRRAERAFTRPWNGPTAMNARAAKRKAKARAKRKRTKR